MMDHDARRHQFLVFGVSVLMLGVTVVLAVEYLSALYQLPILILSFAGIIFLSRRVVKLERHFTSRNEGWSAELARFREENK
jgi:hypothetical protein